MRNNTGATLQVMGEPKSRSTPWRTLGTVPPRSVGTFSLPEHGYWNFRFQRAGGKLGEKQASRELLFQPNRLAEVSLYPKDFGVTVLLEPGADSPGAKETVDISGRWRHDTPGVGSATWTFTREGKGYRAVESGLGNAVGTASVTGSRIEIQWQAGAYAGKYWWNLDASGRNGTGQLIFSRGGQGTHNSKLTRL